MKLNKTQKITLAAVGAVFLQISALKIAYTFGSTDGFLKGREGYMRTPRTAGTVTLDNNGKPTFTPFPEKPLFHTNVKWNSKENKRFIEDQIKTNMGTTQFGQWVKTRVASATCSATETPNLWFCSYRVLGDSSNSSGYYEVNPKTGDWQGR